MDEREALVALNLLPRIGPVRVKRIMEYLGSANAVFSASSQTLMNISGLGSKTIELIKNWESSIDLQAELELANQRELKIITLADSDYPEPLRQMYDPPIVLYVWGEITAKDNHNIAMVGSRKHTYYGQQCARKLSFQLASNGVTVISGLARGIDTFSHEGAIAAGGRTIAVIGSGLGQIYPAENMALASKIAAGHGAVISEFPINCPPDKRNFPMRNRIVAGWSESVLVVECPKWSGSLITANLATDMGKPIYAVPGPIDSPTSAGCNDLIREGATLVTSADDIFSDRELLPLFQAPAQTTKNPKENLQKESLQKKSILPDFSEKEQRVIDQLSSTPVAIDFLIEKTMLTFPELSVTLIQLEMKKLISQLPGQHYVRAFEI